MKKFICIFLALITCACLCSCNSGAPENAVFSVSDLQDRHIGVMTGSVAQGSSQLSEYGDTQSVYKTSDEVLKALEDGDIDCAVLEYDIADALNKKSSHVTMLDEPFVDETYCFIAAKENIALTEDINTILSGLVEDGTLASIIGGYTAQTGYKYESSLTDSDGSISLLVFPDNPPYVSRNGSEYSGLDIDIATAICDRLGIGLDITELQSGENPVDVIQSGGADIAMGMIKNSEDAKIVDFSDPYFTSKQMILVRK